MKTSSSTQRLLDGEADMEISSGPQVDAQSQGFESGTVKKFSGMGRAGGDATLWLSIRFLWRLGNATLSVRRIELEGSLF